MSEKSKLPPLIKINELPLAIVAQGTSDNSKLNDGPPADIPGHMSDDTILRRQDMISTIPIDGKTIDHRIASLFESIRKNPNFTDQEHLGEISAEPTKNIQESVNEKADKARKAMIHFVIRQFGDGFYDDYATPIVDFRIAEYRKVEESTSAKVVAIALDAQNRERTIDSRFLRARTKEDDPFRSMGTYAVKKVNPISKKVDMKYPLTPSDTEAYYRLNHDRDNTSFLAVDLLRQYIKHINHPLTPPRPDLLPMMENLVEDAGELFNTLSFTIPRINRHPKDTTWEGFKGGTDRSSFASSSELWRVKAWEDLAS